jgi:hypothetical protein
MAKSDTSDGCHYEWMSASDEDVARPTAFYPKPEITPAEFEIWVTSIFDAARDSGGVDDLRVSIHEVIEGTDGTYDFDATLRYELAGLEFLVLVEAKLHKNPIKRETVQILRQKLQSVGAQKAVLISTAPFQKGALDFALAHGIALVTVTEGRFTYETRGAIVPPKPTRQEAIELGIPVFVGHAYGPGDEPGSVVVTLIAPEYADYVVEQLLPSRQPD